jgi:glutaredoxin
MPSQRRMRVFGLIIALAVILTLYMTTSAQQTRSSAFYQKTREALKAEHDVATKQRSSDDVGARLKAAEDAAKDSAEKKHAKWAESVEGSPPQVPVGGKKFDKGGDKTGPVEGVATVGGRPRDKLENKESETPEEHEVEVELNAILKKSPSKPRRFRPQRNRCSRTLVIIFSKTFCPHSKDAKRVLLTKYNLVPEPFVVELDEHPLGPKLQTMLGERTGRKTVPNVLVLGKSIGGGDDIIALDSSDKLLDKVKSMAGSRIVQAERRQGQSEIRRRKRRAD